MNTRRWLITLAICISIFAALGVTKVMQIRAAIAYGNSFPEPSETVESAYAESHSVQQKVSTIGELVMPQTLALHTEIEGRIVAVNFISGAIVEQGQVLIQLDIAEEVARLQAAKASAKLAKLDVKRISKLRRNKTVSEERFDQAKAQQDIALANIGALQATIDKKTLRAPFRAHTGIHDFEIGEYLGANAFVTDLVGINDYVWVDFNLPLVHAQINIGDEVALKTLGAKHDTVNATIIAKNSIMSAESRNLRFRARLPHQARFHHNEVVNITVAVENARLMARVPTTSILHDDLGDYVYVLEAEASGESYRARRQSVVLGAEEGQFRSIVSGVDKGDHIAANGAFKLRSGLRVFVAQRQTKLPLQH